MIADDLYRELGLARLRALADDEPSDWLRQRILHPQRLIELTLGVLPFAVGAIRVAQVQVHGDQRGTAPPSTHGLPATYIEPVAAFLAEEDPPVNVIFPELLPRRDHAAPREPRARKPRRRRAHDRRAS
jgi:hypothetical protein